MKPTDLAVYLRAFLTHYLPVQRRASPNTISGYRYTFVLLLRYCEAVCKIPVQRLCLEDIDPARVLAFLDYIQNERGGCAQTRNHRLAALHSFFRYVQTQAPEQVSQCQRILAIPLQRISHEDPTYLSSSALAALLDQPDRSTRTGRRDAVLLSVLYDTGARVQELIDLRVCDVHLASPAWVRLTGKGRKTRLVPLMTNTARALGQYLRDERLDEPASAEAWLFKNQRGGQFSRWGIRYLLKRYSEQARTTCPDLPERITPHTLRHTKAMHLLQAGNPPIVIRDILGHADIESTDVYARADLEMKRRALEKAPDVVNAPARRSWQREPDLLAWLRSL
jgi:site-specific recombinase XerD